MKYLRLFEEHEDKIGFFKTQIDWKLVRYIQTILTEYWDIPITTLYFHIRVSDYVIWFNDYEEEGFYQNGSESFWGNLYGDYRNRGEKIKYVIGFADDNMPRIYYAYIKEIISKLNNKYNIDYEETFSCISFYSDDIKQK